MEINELQKGEKLTEVVTLRITKSDRDFLDNHLLDPKKVFKWAIDKLKKEKW